MNTLSRERFAASQEDGVRLALENRRRQACRPLAERIREEREVLQMLSRRAFVKRRPKPLHLIARALAKRVYYGERSPR